jgi:hypothetical protein
VLNGTQSSLLLLLLLSILLLVLLLISVPISAETGTLGKAYY